MQHLIKRMPTRSRAVPWALCCWLRVWAAAIRLAATHDGGGDSDAGPTAVGGLWAHQVPAPSAEAGPTRMGPAGGGYGRHYGGVDAARPGTPDQHVRMAVTVAHPLMEKHTAESWRGSVVRPG